MLHWIWILPLVPTVCASTTLVRSEWLPKSRVPHWLIPPLTLPLMMVQPAPMTICTPTWPISVPAAWAVPSRLAQEQNNKTAGVRLFISNFLSIMNVGGAEGRWRINKVPTTLNDRPYISAKLEVHG